MKKFTFHLLLCLLLFSAATHAQQAEKFDPQKDQETLRGYVIHLLPAPGNTFGFIIIKDKTTIWSQINNPFAPGAQHGFTQKSDAYKLAEWILGQKETNSKTPIILKPELAKQLNITEGLPKR